MKKARQLGCETFFGTIDTVDTLTNMELDDELKLRVATRLMDKSVATLWDNLKLHFTTLVTWDYFVQEVNEQYYIHFH